MVSSKERYVIHCLPLVDFGPTKNTGYIGWYVPPWMATQYPDITKWENLNKYAALFKRIHDVTLQAGKFLGATTANYATPGPNGRPDAADFRVFYTGSSFDGYQPPGRGQQPAAGQQAPARGQTPR